MSGRGLPDGRNMLRDLFLEQALLDQFFRIGIDRDPLSVSFKMSNSLQQVAHVVDWLTSKLADDRDRFVVKFLWKQHPQFQFASITDGDTDGIAAVGFF